MTRDRQVSRSLPAVLRGAAVLLAARFAVAEPLLTDLRFPTYVSFEGGRVLVAEKQGVVKVFDEGLKPGVAPRVLLDIQGQVSSYGDHGLMGALVFKNWLWLAYSRETPCDPAAGCGPSDARPCDGAINGRPNAQIFGCMLFGRLSRFPYDPATGRVTGGEQILMDGADNGKQACTQFSTHGMTGLVVGPDGFIYASHGDGASFQGPDEGQYGNNPCNDDPAYPGGFRAQNPRKVNGKVLRVDPDSGAWTIFSTGHRNPYRLTVWRGQIYSSDTGWFTWEEANLVTANSNLGWPCYEGPEGAPLYAGMGRCQPVFQGAVNPQPSGPFVMYKHPPNAVGNVASISAIAGWGDGFYVGDFTMGTIWRYTADGKDRAVVANDAWPVGLFASPQGLLYIDYNRGQVSLVPGTDANGGGAVPQNPLPPTPPPAVAYMKAVPQQAAWQPKTLVSWSADSNIGGREGFNTEWEVVLHFDCTPGDACKAATLISMNGPADRSVTFPAPPIGGTLRVRVHGWTFAGLQQDGVDLQAAQGNPLCACTGARTVVSPASINWHLNNGGGGGGGGGAGIVAITLTAFPAANTLGAIAGKVSGLAEGSTATLRIWLRTKPLNDEWWTKPNIAAAAAIPLAADGSFTIANWASDPAQDVAWTDIRIAVIPPGMTVPDVLGWPVPAAVLNGALAVQTFPRGYVPGGGGGQPPPPPPPPPPPAGQGAIALTAFPAPGSTSGIAGIVTGLPVPAAGNAAYKAVMYLEGPPPNPPGSFWIKPYPGSSVPLVQQAQAGGQQGWTFTFAGWASAPATDQNFLSIRIFILPAATAVADALGAPIPAAVIAAAVASGSYPKGYVPTAPGPSVPPTTMPGTAQLVITEWPLPGDTTPMGGSLQGVDTPGAFRVAAYLIAPSGLAYSKPYPGDAATIQPDGSWRIAGWATSPQNDPSFVRMVFVVVTQATPILPVVGGPLPAYGNGVLTTLSVPRTFVPANGNGGGGGGNQQPPPPQGQPVLTVLRFPAAGAIDPITGVVSGLPPAGAFRAAVYVGHLDRGAGTMDWWYKTTAAVAAPSGAFTAAWATQPPDGHADFFQIYIVPAAVPVPVVLGGRLPATLENAAVVKGRYPQGYVPPVAGASGAGADTAGGNDGPDDSATSDSVSGLAAGLIVGGALVGAVLAAAAVAIVQRRRARAEAQGNDAAAGAAAANASSAGAPGRSSSPARTIPGQVQQRQPGGDGQTTLPAASSNPRTGPTPKSRKNADRQRPAALDGNAFAAVPLRTPGACGAAGVPIPTPAVASTSAATAAAAAIASSSAAHRKQK